VVGRRTMARLHRIEYSERLTDDQRPARSPAAYGAAISATHSRKAIGQAYTGAAISQAWPQPLLVVRDVPASSRFYQQVLAAESGHGGEEYEQVVSNDEILLQLHALDVEDHHGRLADPDQPLGNGVLLWFEVADFQATVERVRASGASVVRDEHTNPNARQQEIWVRDPDGYLVVLAGPSAYRSRA
jgi:catechol 2,3-dioxygenase-like lactoylglutathione lyase family enzyme